MALVEGRAQVGRRLYFGQQPALINGGGCALLQHAQAQGGGWIVKPNCQKAPLLIKDNGQIAWIARVALAFNRILKEPGMAPPQRPFRLAADMERKTPLGWLRQVCQLYIWCR